MDPLASYKTSDFTFNELIPFSANSIIVKRGDKFGVYVHPYVGLKEVWADEMIPVNSGKYGNDGFYQASVAIYRMGNKWGIISKRGKVEMEPMYYSFKIISSGRYLVEYKKDHWGYINTNARKQYFR